MTATVCVTSFAVVVVPKVAVIVLLLNVPVESGAVLRVTTPEPAREPAVVAEQYILLKVPARGAMNVALVAVVFVQALVAEPGEAKNTVTDDVQVPVPIPVKTLGPRTVPVVKVDSGPLKTVVPSSSKIAGVLLLTLLSAPLEPAEIVVPPREYTVPPPVSQKIP